MIYFVTIESSSCYVETAVSLQIIKREKDKCWRVFVSALKTAIAGACEEEGCTFVAFACSCSLGCSPGHAGAMERER